MFGKPALPIRFPVLVNHRSCYDGLLLFSTLHCITNHSTWRPWQPSGLTALGLSSREESAGLGALLPLPFIAFMRRFQHSTVLQCRSSPPLEHLPIQEPLLDPLLRSKAKPCPSGFIVSPHLFKNTSVICGAVGCLEIPPFEARYPFHVLGGKPSSLPRGLGIPHSPICPLDIIL